MSGRSSARLHGAEATGGCQCTNAVDLVAPGRSPGSAAERPGGLGRSPERPRGVLCLHPPGSRPLSAICTPLLPGPPRGASPESAASARVARTHRAASPRPRRCSDPPPAIFTAKARASPHFTAAQRSEAPLRAYYSRGGKRARTSSRWPIFRAFSRKEYTQGARRAVGGQEGKQNLFPRRNTNLLVGLFPEAFLLYLGETNFRLPPLCLPSSALRCFRPESPWAPAASSYFRQESLAAPARKLVLKRPPPPVLSPGGG